MRLTTFGGASSSVATTSSPAIFASMIRCSSSWYSSLYSVEVERRLEVADHLLRQLDLVRLDLRRHGLELLDVVHAAHFVGVPHRVHHEAVLARLDGDEVLAAVERELADAGLALHPLAHDRERLGAIAPSGREVVRPLDVDRIDRGGVGELHEVDHARRLGTHLRHVLLVMTTYRPFSNS